jgi:hypothetical protein
MSSFIFLCGAVEIYKKKSYVNLTTIWVQINSAFI